jgi:mono/diheme cytochrome c family protein
MSFFRFILVTVVCVFTVACAESGAPSGTVTVSDESQTPTPTIAVTPEPAELEPVDIEPAAPAAAVAAPVAQDPVPTAAASPTDPAAHPYTVTCATGAAAAEQCVVDKATYIGWRTFAGQCQVCHGGSALGSTFAPNLLDRFHERVDHPRFVEVVLNGYRGQVGVMPAWKGNPNVVPHIDAMYAYLKARADGVLPPGRPARAP